MNRLRVRIAALSAFSALSCMLCTYRDASAASTFNFASDLAGSASSVRIYAIVQPEKHRPPVTLRSLPPGPCFGTVDIDLQRGDVVSGFVVVGLDNVGGVMVGFSNPVGYGTVRRPFDSVFPGFSESDVSTMIQTGVGLDSFIDKLAGDSATVLPDRVLCRVSHFSDEAPYGTIIISTGAIPEPASAVCSGVSLLALAQRRRR